MVYEWSLISFLLAALSNQKYDAIIVCGSSIFEDARPDESLKTYVILHHTASIGNTRQHHLLQTHTTTYQCFLLGGFTKFCLLDEQSLQQRCILKEELHILYLLVDIQEITNSQRLILLPTLHKKYVGL